MAVTDLPTLNASLNLLAAVLLALGYASIRRGDVRRHRACMLAACAVSVAFLASYSVYHWQVGSVAYTGQGWIRPVYFAILISHILLAMASVPLVASTLWRAWRGAFRAHRRIARWTFPSWMYVSVTGVIVYWMLYHG
ncbi:MAG: DUF420 domain-containing protein [Bryobacterales bacterium]|nr:DUF420 domain-containing protein [Bryobacterales bacterium]